MARACLIMLANSLSTSGVTVAPAPIISGPGTAPLAPNRLPPIVPAMPSSTIQIAIWVSTDKPTPMILPIMRWKGRQLLTTTSTMRLVFSSTTLFMIIVPLKKTNQKMINESAIPKNKAMSVEDSSSSPVSLHLMA